MASQRAVPSLLQRELGRRLLGAWSYFEYREGWFVLARTVFLAGILSMAVGFDHVIAHIVLDLVALCLILDALAANTAYVFLSGLPISPVRSAILTIGTYFNLAQGFAVGWVWHDGHACPWPHRVLTATYESLRTLTTVGPENKPERWDGKLLVMTELLVGIYFVATVIAIYASWARTGRSA